MDPAVGVGGEEELKEHDGADVEARDYAKQADAVRILSSYLDHHGGTLTNDIANEGMLIQYKFYFL